MRTTPTTGVSFNDSDVVHNVLSHSVLQQNQGLLNLREIGEKAEDEFIEKRIIFGHGVSLGNNEAAKTLHV